MKISNVNTIIFIIVLFSFLSCKQNNNDILYSKKYTKEIKQARRQAGIFLTINSIPGGTFAVAKEGKIIYSEGLGMASKELKVAATRKTKFRIGAISELFTSAIYYKMAERGIFHSDSLIQNYYPEFPEKQFPIPVKHLLYHTSGIMPSSQKEQYFNSNTVSVQKGINFFKDDSLFASPGSKQLPTQYNYNLLGAIMEKVTNKKFPEILNEYITDTLNLENTVTDNPLITINGRSIFFDSDLISQTINAITKDLRYCAPSLGILSNAEDLVKFGNALLYSEYFSEDLKKNLFKPYLINGIEPFQLSNGWVIMKDSSGRTIYGRSGGVTGGGASLIIYPDEKLVVACAVNLTSTTRDFPVYEIAANFLAENNSQSSK